jgi:hypothetical protein
MAGLTAKMLAGCNGQQVICATRPAPLPFNPPGECRWEVVQNTSPIVAMVSPSSEPGCRRAGLKHRSNHNRKVLSVAQPLQHAQPVAEGQLLVEMAPGVTIAIDDARIDILESTPAMQSNVTDFHHQRSKDNAALPTSQLQQKTTSQVVSQRTRARRLHNQRPAKQRSGMQHLVRAPTAALPVANITPYLEEDADDESEDELDYDDLEYGEFAEDHDPFAPEDPDALLEAPEAQLIQQRILQLAELLRLRPQRAEALAASCPELVLRPADVLQDNMRHLVATLQLSTPTVIDAILVSPTLLLLAPAQLQQHLEALAAPLGLPLKLVMASRDLKAVLIRLHPQQVSDRVRLLARLTKMPAASAAPLALEAPALLTSSEQQLRRHISYLASTLKLPANGLGHLLTHAPGLLVMLPRQLDATLSEVATAMRSDAAAVVELVKQEVALALVPAKVVRQVAAAVTSSLQCTTAYTAELLRRCPAILLRGPGSVTTCVQLLAGTFQLDPPALLQLVKYDPNILQESPGTLKVSWLAYLHWTFSIALLKDSHAR